MADPGTQAAPLGRGKRIAFTAILLALVCALCIAVLEAGLRLTMSKQQKTAQAMSYAPRDGYYTYQPGAQVRFTNEDKRVIEFTADAYGLRNPPDSLKNARVILLGDSFMSALNTPEGQTVAGRLRARGIRVFNAGMDGYATVNSLHLLEDLLKESRPETVLLFFYLGNDLRDNYFTPMRQGPDLPMPRPGSPPPQSLAKRLCGKSALCYRINQIRTGVKPLPVAGDKQGGKQPPAQPQDPMANYCLSELLSLRTEYGAPMQQAAERTGAAFQSLNALTRAHRARLVILGLPSKAMVFEDMARVPYADVEQRFEKYVRENRDRGFSFDRTDRAVRDLAAAHGIEYVSLLELFRENRGKRIYYKDDPHWTGLGQEITADFVAENVLK